MTDASMMPSPSKDASLPLQVHDNGRLVHKANVKRPGLPRRDSRLKTHSSSKPVPATDINPMRRTMSSASEKTPLLGGGVKQIIRPPARVYYSSNHGAAMVDLEANRRAGELLRRWERQWDVESCVLVLVILISLMVFGTLGWKTQARLERTQ